MLPQLVCLSWVPELFPNLFNCRKSRSRKECASVDDNEDCHALLLSGLFRSFYVCLCMCVTVNTHMYLYVWVLEQVCLCGVQSTDTKLIDPSCSMVGQWAPLWCDGVGLFILHSMHGPSMLIQHRWCLNGTNVTVESTILSCLHCSSWYLY